jgi:hypothetical protein
VCAAEVYFQIVTDSARSQIVSRIARDNGVLSMDFPPGISFYTPEPDDPTLDPTTPTQTPTEFAQHQRATPSHSPGETNPFEDYPMNRMRSESGASVSVERMFIIGILTFDILCRMTHRKRLLHLDAHNDRVTWWTSVNFAPFVFHFRH